MDLVGYSQDVFNNIVIDYALIAEKLGLKDITYIPISALLGENIVNRSEKISWYDGPSLLEILEKWKWRRILTIHMPGSLFNTLSGRNYRSCMIIVVMPARSTVVFIVQVMKSPCCHLD
jgi:hypothetical protein